MSPGSATALLVALLWMVPEGAAHAQEEGSPPYYLHYQSSATGPCRAANALASSALRYRPIGIYNTGDTAVDVVCSYPTESSDWYDVELTFYNYNAAATNVTCVVIGGARDNPYETGSRTKSISVPAGNSAKLLVNTAASVGYADAFDSYSCRLAPGIEMATIDKNMFCYYGCGGFTQTTRQVAATAVCQPRTPADLGGLRNRPLGIFNNKPEAVYVSCSMFTGYGGDLGEDALAIDFLNSTGAPLEVACTAQGGSRTAGANNYTGSISVAARSSAQLLFPQIHRKAQDAHVNLSCLLPGGIEMGQLSLSQTSPEDDL